MLVKTIETEKIYFVLDDLVISNATEPHIREIAELWANLASLQQIYAPKKYDFKLEGKDWQSFVRRKLSKKNNLLLVACKKDNLEVQGFLYLQTIIVPPSNAILKAVVEDVYTKPQYREQGIAKKLLNVALDWASTQNIKHVDIVSLNPSKDIYSRLVEKAEKDINVELVTV